MIRKARTYAADKAGKKITSQKQRAARIQVNLLLNYFKTEQEEHLRRGKD